MDVEAVSDEYERDSLSSYIFVIFVEIDSCLKG